MTNYAVGYTVGGSEPEKNADGEEYVPEHAVPIVDGVAVADAPVTVGEDGHLAEAESEPKACSETTAAGEPCKGTPGEDGLCGVHRKQKAAAGDDDEDAEPDEDDGTVSE